MTKFLLFTDLHYDFIPDGHERINSLIKQTKNHDYDFIMNLGDFCIPVDQNKNLLKQLESSGLPCYHALGNHDCDRFEKQEILDFLGLKKSYYSFSFHHTKFIVLDACYTKVNNNFEAYNRNNYKTSGGDYPIIPDRQIKWLQNELEDDYKEAIIFSHHSLENEFSNRGIFNRKAIQDLLGARVKAGKRITCFNGHDHADSKTTIDGVHYIGINGMSYIWFGDQIVKKFIFR